MTNSDIKVDFSEPYEVIDADQKFYTTNNEYVVNAKAIDRKGVHIQSFKTPGLNHVATNFFKDMPRNAEFSNLVEAQGKFFLIYSILNRGGDSETFYKRQIDPKTAKFKGEGTSIFTINGEVAENILTRQNVFENKPGLKTYYKVSSDKDKIVMINGIIEEESKKFKYVVHVLDSDMNILNETTVNFTDQEVAVKVESALVTNDGDLYLLVAPKGNLELCHLDTDGSVNRKTISLEPEQAKEGMSFSQFVQSAELKMVENNEMIIGGFCSRTMTVDYSDEKKHLIKYYVKSGEIVKVGKGLYKEIPKSNHNIFTVKFSPDLNIKSRDVIEIPKELKIKNEDIPEKDLDKNMDYDFHLSGLRVKDLIQKEDNSILIIGEEYGSYSFTTTGRSMATGHVSTNQYSNLTYGDIIFAEISSSGRVTWSKKFPKRQVATFGKMENLSSKLISDNNTYYMLFADKEENKNVKTGMLPAKYPQNADGSFFYVNVDGEDGSSNREEIIDFRNRRAITAYNFKFENVLQISDKLYIMEAYKKGKKDVWIEFKLP